MIIVLAHTGVVTNVEWSLLLAGSLFAAWLYHRGSVALPGMSERRLRTLSFWGALALAAAVFSPPFDAAADALFSVHMVQHLVLIVPIPVMLVFAHAGRCVVRGWSPPVRRVSRHPRRLLVRAGSRVSLPVVGVAFALVLWVWHLPATYDAAVANEWLHLLEHATFLGSSSLLWGALMDRRHGFLPRSLLVLSTGFHCGLLGAILVFAPITLYRSHVGQTLVDISPLQDQQVAGGIMWLPMGSVFMATIVALIYRTLERSETGRPADA